MSKPEEKLQNPRRHHVLFLRHCVRSVKPTFSFNLESELGHHKTRFVKDYIASPLPQWGVPNDWCSPGSLKFLRGTGEYLMKHVFLSDSEPKDKDGKRKIQFQIISDTAHRDVDTSLAISQGMSKIAAETPSSRLETDGLSRINLDFKLFNPYKEGKNDPPPMCKKTFSKGRKHKDIFDRFKKVSSPRDGLYSTLKRVQKLGGTKKKGPLTLMDYVSNVTLSSHAIPQGPIHILKVIGEMMLYSRAMGDIDPVYLPDATLDDTYRILQWVFYLRSALGVDNVESASRGIVFADAVLKALQSRHLESSNDKQDFDTLVTIFVGHDSDMLALSTIFGLRWNLKAPYHRGKTGDDNEYMMTPPGSCMHFIHDFESKKVGLSYLYPVYLKESSNRKKKYQLNTKGDLKTVPMRLVNNTYDSKFSEDKSVMWFDSDDHANGMFGGMHVLNQELQASLQKYPEVLDCYTKFANESTAAISYTPSSVELPRETYDTEKAEHRLALRFFSLIGLVATFLVLLLLWSFKRKCCTSSSSYKKNIAYYKKVKTDEEVTDEKQ
uniref:Acid phosphatase n=1 Tax=Corethron hystrix TaxID=216773 RepID=A0A7S1B5N5_9STRA|mmetsp:Transcript_12400/g.27216  ORF Transcript_12400/g.27216 Transcript_12400/m.27216 type:complete len:551 (+) Transcript_12400:25-1677(+)